MLFRALSSNSSTLSGMYARFETRECLTLYPWLCFLMLNIHSSKRNTCKYILLVGPRTLINFLFFRSKSVGKSMRSWVTNYFCHFNNRTATKDLLGALLHPQNCYFGSYKRKKFQWLFCYMFIFASRCTTGKHTSEKPQTTFTSSTKKSVTTPVGHISSPTISREACSRCRQGFFCSDHGVFGFLISF